MLRVATLIKNFDVKSQYELESLITYLRNKGYMAIIRSMFIGMLSSVNSPEPYEQLITRMITKVPRDTDAIFESVKLGDLFITNDIVYTLNPFGGKFYTTAIGYEKQDEALRKFCEDIEEYVENTLKEIRVKETKLKLSRLTKSEMAEIVESIQSKPLPFDLYLKIRDELESISTEHGIDILKLKDDVSKNKESELRGSEPNYSSEEFKATNLLMDIDARRFVQRLKRLKKIMSKDVANLIKSDTLQLLLSNGLVTEEYLLTCKKNQHDICLIPSKDYLNRDSFVSSRCDFCGRSYLEENLQVFYTLTESGKKLIDGSLWMSIWITELLLENGVKKDCIKWGLEVGGEELDIMVEDFGSRLFLELKDREFGVGDAVKFIYRVDRYGGNLGIVVTMDKVASDANKAFEEISQRQKEPIRIKCLEGLENIPDGIKKIVEGIALSQVRGIIRLFSNRLGVDLWPIVENWVNRKKANM